MPSQEKRSTRPLRMVAAFALVALAGCEGPIVARSVDARYRLAQAQLANGRFPTALSTLARVQRDDMGGETGRRAQLLRLAVLSGVARGFQDMGERYLQGHQQESAGPVTTELRTVGMSYFSRARNYVVELMGAVDLFVSKPPAEPWVMDWPRLGEVSKGREALERIAAGVLVEEAERLEAEQARIWLGVARALPVAAEGEGRDVEIEPAAFYLSLARELARLSDIFGPQALAERRSRRLCLERAAAAAEGARERARDLGEDKLAERSEAVLTRVRKLLETK